MVAENNFISGSGTQSKKIRNVSKSHYSKVEDLYNQTLVEKETCTNRITDLKKVLKTRKEIQIINKKEKEVDLNRVQLTARKKELNELKAQLITLNSKRSVIGSRYQHASRISSVAIKNKMQGKQERKFLAKEAMNNIELIMKDIRQLFSQFGDTNSASFESLKSLATRNGRMFHLNFMKILREILQDSSQEIRAWVLSSPKVQGELSRMMRVSYGYTKQ